ncbi:MAG TPA: NAD(P)-dependent oxidoreductase [bacterium]|nr:NAD(P)-dependent oxidoreductase [bacterium]
MTPQEPPARRIGFLGLGYMGSRMAHRLLGAHHRVTVFNRTADKARPLLEAGASLAATPRAVAEESDVILYSLADDAVVREVILGPAGVLAGVRRGGILIDLSTVLPDTSRAVSAAALSRGAAAIDAPVSGSTVQAEQGTLIIFVGGDRDAYASSAPILDILGRHTYMGASGTGATMKLVTNTLLGLGVQALAEAVALGRKAGLDTKLMLDVLGSTAVVSAAQKGKFENVARGQFPAAFALRMMSKDFGLILRLAESLSVFMPAVAAAKQIDTVEHAQSQGREEDFSAVVRTIQQLSGIGN